MKNRFSHFVGNVDYGNRRLIKLLYAKFCQGSSAVARVCRKVCVNCHNPFYVKNQKLVIDQN